MAYGELSAANCQPGHPYDPHLVAGYLPTLPTRRSAEAEMSGDGNTKHTEDYLTLHPWSGDNGSHEDWEKVLSLKALSLGGNIMYQWVRGEGPDIVPANLDPIGRAIHAYIEAIDFKSAEKAWDSDYFWSINLCRTRMRTPTFLCSRPV